MQSKTPKKSNANHATFRMHHTPELDQRGRASPSLHQRKTVSSEPHQLIRRPQTSLHTCEYLIVFIGCDLLLTEYIFIRSCL